MVYWKVLVLTIFFICSTGYKSAFGQSIAENIRPVGQLCVAGQACVGRQINAADGSIEEVSNTSNETESSANEPSNNSGEATSIASTSGETHEVEMRNQGSDGVMVFEPSVLQVQVGDSVTFKATDRK